VSIIRADWTPLWAADTSCRKSLGGSQAACLEFLRKHGSLTRADLHQRRISRATLDSLFLSGRCYPPLVDWRQGDPQWFRLAAWSQQDDLASALAIIAGHPDGITWSRLSGLLRRSAWTGAVLYHVSNSGLARYKDDVFYPAQPGEQQALMHPAHLATARVMRARWMP
jgi:hypothetical protein